MLGSPNHGFRLGGSNLQRGDAKNILDGQRVSIGMRKKIPEKMQRVEEVSERKNRELELLLTSEGLFSIYRYPRMLLTCF